jgi:fibrillarin-like rRNA methylase
LMLKVRSVSQRRPTATIVREARAALLAVHLAITFETALTPFSREHVALTLSA